MKFTLGLALVFLFTVLVDSYRVTFSNPGIYTVTIPRNLIVEVLFGPRTGSGFQLFRTEVYGPANITARIEDCRVSDNVTTVLYVNDYIVHSTTSAEQICPASNIPSDRGNIQVTRTEQGRPVLYLGVVNESNLESLFAAKPRAVFLTEPGEELPVSSHSFASPGSHSVTVPSFVTEAKAQVVGGGGGGSAAGILVAPCFSSIHGGGGGGAGGTAFGKVSVTPGKKYNLQVGSGGEGGTSAVGKGGDGLVSVFLTLSGGGGEGASGPSGGAGGKAIGPSTFDGSPGGNGHIGGAGVGGKPYLYPVFDEGVGGDGGSQVGEPGKPGNAGMVIVTFVTASSSLSSSMETLEQFHSDVERLTKRCGIFSVYADESVSYLLNEDDPFFEDIPHD